MESKVIFGIKVPHRGQRAPEVQTVITKYGSRIIGRMGVPSLSKEDGLIVLIFEGDRELAANLREDLEDIPEIVVRTIDFEQQQ